jgi:hypothetical protein
VGGFFGIDHVEYLACARITITKATLVIGICIRQKVGKAIGFVVVTQVLAQEPAILACNSCFVDAAKCGV